MYHLYDQAKGQYITSTVSCRKHGGGYAIYYGDQPNGSRWATRKGAENCIERLVNTGSLPTDHQIEIVYLEGQR